MVTGGRNDPVVAPQVTTKMPLDKWVCLEAGLVAAGGGQIGWHVWMDDVEIITRATGSPSPQPLTNIGFAFYSGEDRGIPAPFDVFLDDVAVSDKRIGCMK